MNQPIHSATAAMVQLNSRCGDNSTEVLNSRCGELEEREGAMEKVGEREGATQQQPRKDSFGGGGRFPVTPGDGGPLCPLFNVSRADMGK